MKSVLIYGWFGEENLGDELILKSAINMVKQVDNNIKINVMGTKPNKIKKNHTSVYCTSTYKTKGLKSNIRLLRYGILNYNECINSDCLIISCGGALSDWNEASTDALFRIIETFKAKNKNILMLGCGAGPITKKESYEKFYNILKGIELITLRDEISYNELKKIGLNNLKLTNDIVFNLKSEDFDCFNYLEKGNEKNVGIVVSPTYLKGDFEEKSEKNIIKYIKKLQQEKCNPLLIPFQYTEDKEMMDRISDATGCKVYYDAKENVWNLIKILKEQDIVVGLRLHCVITCVILGIPVIPIIYHSKVYSVAKEFDILQFSEEIGDGYNWKESYVTYEGLMKSTEYYFENLKTISNNYNNKLKSKYEESENIKILDRFLNRSEK